MNKLLVAAMTALTFTHGAEACVEVKVYNDSDKEIDVVWTALGCAGTHDSFIAVCHHHRMEPNSGPRHHNFDWGKTLQGVTFHYPVVVDGVHKWVRSDYGYIHKNRDFELIKKFSTSPSGCGKHYKIHYTNEDVARDIENAYVPKAISTEMDSEA